MVKQRYDLAFKKEVATYIVARHTTYEAATHFSARDHHEYDKSTFYEWYRNIDKILVQSLYIEAD